MAKFCKVKLNPLSLDWLHKNKIFIAAAQDGADLYFWDFVKLEPYVYFSRTNVIHQLKFLSYSNTNEMAPMSQINCGRFCSIAPYVKTQFNHRHPYEYLTTSPITHNSKGHPNLKAYEEDYSFSWEMYPDPQKQIFSTIENDVWIGSNVFINSGVTISNGAIVAANSCVVKNVGPYEIVGGNPAKVIKKRFSDNLIERLLKSEWWNYDPANLSHFGINNPETFLDKFEEIKMGIKKLELTSVSLLEMPVSDLEVLVEIK